MASEILLLTYFVRNANAPYVAFISTPMVGVVWLSTFLLQVPIHGKLSGVKDDVLIERLVKTNWIRTAAWSIKALFMTTIIF